MTAAWLYVRIRENPAREDQERLFNAAAVVSLVAIIAVAALRQWESFQEVDGPLDHWVKTIDRSFMFGGLILCVALASRPVQWAVGNR